MKRKVLFITLTFAVTVVGIAAAVSTTKKSSVTAAYPRNTPQQKVQTPALDPPGTINGATNPELIPDHAAFMLVFRLIASATSEQDRQHIRSYVRELGVGRPACLDCPETGSTEVDIDALINLAHEFQREVGVLDQQVEKIKDRSWPNPTPEVMTQLKQLEGQFDSILKQKVALLDKRLTGPGFNSLHQQVRERVKRRVKYFPGPATAPGGPEWQQPHHQ